MRAMHRLSSILDVFRLQVSAVLFFLRYALLVSTFSTLFYSVLVADRDLAVLAMILGGLTLITVTTQWLLSPRTRCPLCLTPILSPKKCSKHRKARKLMGSHRLLVASQILFKGTFRCPYCHEHTAVEERVRPKR